MDKHCLLSFRFAVLLMLSSLVRTDQQLSPPVYSDNQQRLTMIIDDDDGSDKAGLRDRREAGREHHADSIWVNINYYHVRSEVYMHFATVTIESEVTNRDTSQTRKFSFNLGIPREAFLMSTFKVFVDEYAYMGQKLQGDDSDKWYRMAQQNNHTAGRLQHQSDGRLDGDMELYNVNLILAPGGNASFSLSYAEQLVRQGGEYKQRLMIQPGGLVDDLLVSATFAEEQKFSNFSHTLPNTNSSVETKEDSASYRQLLFRPSLATQQHLYSQEGMHGGFTLVYSLDSESEGGSIFVHNDSFVHSLTADSLPPLPKNVLFIIDISGSMEGKKIEEARYAMLKILNDLGEQSSDRFNIMFFNDKEETWQSSPAECSRGKIDEAKTFLLKKMKPSGYTDIHLALIKGLRVLLGDQNSSLCATANMILFLTDGNPSRGITDTEEILRQVTTSNKGRASIYSLGFGHDVKIDFLESLSIKNSGSTQRIDVNEDSEIQLRDFYKVISKPVLCDLAVSYNEGLVDYDQLTGTKFPLFFKGQEIMVMGRLKEPGNISDLKAKTTGNGPQGFVNFTVPAGQVKTVQYPDFAKDHFAKMRAFTKIKETYKNLEKLDSEEKKKNLVRGILVMSETHKFSTKLSPNVSIVIENIEDKRKEMQRLVGNAWSPQGSSWLVLSSLLAPLLLLK